ncbi:uncharacterized protein LOC111879964 [Lactuca sativa]|uniref:uncharacterized protein LOC111879964 n=1 Tax=Lactuca sativa TaxID=4236 RepID=UPI001C68BA49|nr:uncharacterized protein LOC111879964 [Lactuca sativa]
MDLNPHQMHTYMSASDPVSCVFATTTHDHRIHLIAQDSYVAHIEHMTPWMKQLLPSQLVSTPQEQRYLLDTTNPSGYLIFIALVEISNNIQPSKETRKDNQVSYYEMPFLQVIRGCLLQGHTGIHREDNMELLYVLHGQEGGVTHVQFSKDGNYLWKIMKEAEVIRRGKEEMRLLMTVEVQIQHLGKFLRFHLCKENKDTQRKEDRRARLQAQFS